MTIDAGQQDSSNSETAMRQSTYLLIAALLTAGCASEQASGGDQQPEQRALPAPGEVADLSDEPKGTASSEFWDHWGDGKAELSRYEGEVARYGELREADTVLIYVTEPHDRRTWIKDDAVADEHRVNVLKLNHATKFQTGIYPYSVMTSVFSPVDDWGTPRFQPTKVSLTSQEWCGHVFHGVWPGPERFLSEVHSYFAGEGDATRVESTPPDTLYEDALFIQLRELDGEFAGGGDWKGHLVPRLWERRKAHDQLAAVPATITRSQAELDGEPVTRFELRYGDKEVVYDIARAYPRRIVRLKRSDGTHLRLAETTRLPYWRLNSPGDEKYREQLGLPRQR